MNFKEMVDTVIKDLDEKQEDTVIDKIKNYINRGYRQLAKLEKLEAVTIRKVNEKFSKPDELLRIIQILDSNNNPLNFSYEADKIRVNYEGTVTVIYSYLPDKLENNEDEFETNPGNEDYILNYAKWLYNLAEEQEEIAKIYKVEYESMTLIKNNYKMTKTVDVYGGEYNV